jgi:predicted LPLAT superfamily acyltransferase
MALWSGKSKGGKFGYGFFIFLLKHTNIKIVYFFVRFVAFYFLLTADKKPGLFYFQKIHGYSKLKALKSIYQNYFIFGQVLIDKISVLSGIDNPFSYNFAGEEHLRKMATDKTGGLLVGAHIGNWEVAGQLLKRLEVKINIVMYEAEHQKVKEILEQNNIVSEATIIPIKDDYSHLFKIKEAFVNKEIVVMHGDRFLPGTNTMTLPFLGKPAKFPTGPLYLASKNGIPVSFVYAMKETSTHYHFYATKAKQYPYPTKIKNRQQELKTMLKDYLDSLEIVVKKYPLQWFNYYPFWEEEIKH